MSTLFSRVLIVFFGLMVWALPTLIDLLQALTRVGLANGLAGRVHEDLFSHSSRPAMRLIEEQWAK
jgi:hypothetical protein